MAPLSRRGMGVSSGAGSARGAPASGRPALGAGVPRMRLCPANPDLLAAAGTRRHSRVTTCSRHCRKDMKPSPYGGHRVAKDVSHEQASASLGSLLLLWAGIERAARDEVARIHGGCLPKSAHGIARVLDAWHDSVTGDRQAGSLRGVLAAALLDRLKEERRIRNGICHGLLGISGEQGGRSATLSWEINGARSSIPWEQLQAGLRWLSRVPSAMSTISRSSVEEPGSRMIDTSENREWWRAEYGLVLSE